jgi:molybdenum cofactor biosynthesis protein MoaC
MPSVIPKVVGLSHLNSAGEVHMISIASKTSTHRTAVATSTIHFSNPGTYEALSSASLQKGDALAVARVAGISAAKKTADLIPLAHPGLGITGINLNISLITPDQDSHGGVMISASVSCFAPTGVEMEALTAASIAGLTIYDMCKAVDKGMLMEGVRVIEKTGGKSGDWVWEGGVKVEDGAVMKGWRKARDDAGKAEGHSGEYDWDWD